MNQERLDAIKARHAVMQEAASDGHWGTQLGYDCDADTTTHEVHVTGAEPGRTYVASAYIEEIAEFIAHAREDVPALVAEVERLQSQREYLLSVADAQGPDGYVMSHVLRSVLGAS